MTTADRPRWTTTNDLLDEAVAHLASRPSEVARVEVDESVGAAYVYLAPVEERGPIARTIPVEAFLDVDASGKAVGVEFPSWPMT